MINLNVSFHMLFTICVFKNQSKLMYSNFLYQLLSLVQIKKKQLKSFQNIKRVCMQHPLCHCLVMQMSDSWKDREKKLFISLPHSGLFSPYQLFDLYAYLSLLPKDKEFILWKKNTNPSSMGGMGRIFKNECFSQTICSRGHQMVTTLVAAKEQ